MNYGYEIKVGDCQAGPCSNKFYDDEEGGDGDDNIDDEGLMMMMIAVYIDDTDYKKNWSHLSERRPDPMAPTMIPNMYTLWG